MTNLTMQEYLALPAVSASVLRELITRCPAAAHYVSYLNPDRPPEAHDDVTARGTIAHGIVLEGSLDRVKVIDPEQYPSKKGAIPDGWTNDAIRAARDEAIAAGLVPVLAKDMGEIQNMVVSVSRFIDGLRRSEPAIWRAFQAGQGHSEVTIQWDDDSVPCRIRPDRLADDKRLVVDLKFTARSAEPDRWARTHVFGEAYYFNAAFYERGLRETYDVNASYVYLVTECEPPYLCSLVGLDPATLALGAQKVTTALQVWRRCVARNEWPAYPSRVAYPELPAYEAANWQQQQARGDWTALFPELAEAFK